MGCESSGGCKQRIHALNLFIDDIYHDQKIVNDGVMPAELIHSGKCFLAAVRRPESAARRVVPHHRAPTWSATPTASSTCWKTTCAARRACRTCWKTAR